MISFICLKIHAVQFFGSITCVLEWEGALERKSRKRSEERRRKNKRKVEWKWSLKHAIRGVAAAFGTREANGLENGHLNFGHLNFGFHCLKASNGN